MSDFESFSKILKESRSIELQLTFEELKKLLGDLPEESKYRNWWANDSSNDYSKAWCSAGYYVTKVVPDCYVSFARRALLRNDEIRKLEGKTNTIESENTVESIRALHNKPDATKKSDNKDIHVIGAVMLILDLIICIPVLLNSFDDFETFISVLVIGGVFFFISICCIGAGSGGSFVGGYGGGSSGSYYEQAMYNEMKYHNTKMREMLMESEKQRLQEETNRQHEAEPSLAEKFDTRLTNIFRNPWEGIL